MTAASPATATGNLAEAYVAAAGADVRTRRQAVREFAARFGDIDRWRSLPVAERMAGSDAA